VPTDDGSAAVNPLEHVTRALRHVAQSSAGRVVQQRGIYVSFAAALGGPGGWSEPRKILNRGDWYPQIAGSEPGIGTDKQMGRRGRFFLTGRATRHIEFNAR
jgi:hypothetical protein